MPLDRLHGSATEKYDYDEARRSLTGNPQPVHGVFIGIVKNNIDSARRGRLQVYIPDLGGPPDESVSWRTVNHAGPFAGSTGFEKVQPTNTHPQVPHTYGMWFAAPDIDNLVLVTFINGDANRGYWFACVPSTLSHWMVPAMGSTLDAYKEPGTEDGVSAVQYPVCEHNPALPAVNAYSTFPKNKKPVHKVQWKILYSQGLETDSVRGTISSSSHRESPSRVTGLSTPGRPDPDRSGKKPYDKQINTRKGGHTFVLDDGDTAGFDQMIRLRSAGGHQLMLNDKHEILYVANSAGTAWLEFDTTGKIHLYGKDSISLRTEKDFNFHADADINIHSYKTISVYAKDAIKMESKLIQLHATEKLHEWGKKVEIGSGTIMDIHAVDLLNQKSKVIKINASELFHQFGQKVELKSGTDFDIQAINQLNQKAETIQIGASVQLTMSGPTVGMSASGNINAHATGTVNILGGSALVLKGAMTYINSTTPPSVAAATPPQVTTPTPPVVVVPVIIPQIPQGETVKTGKIWKHTSKLNSIVKIMPTHEPSDSVHTTRVSGAPGPS